MSTAGLPGGLYDSLTDPSGYVHIASHSGELSVRHINTLTRAMQSIETQMKCWSKTTIIHEYIIKYFECL